MLNHINCDLTINNNFNDETVINKGKAMNLLMKGALFCVLLFNSINALALVENKSIAINDVKQQQSAAQVTSAKPSLEVNKDNKIALIRFQQLNNIDNFSAKAFYDYGRFSAQSTINQNNNDNITYYLQSSYLVFNGQNIDVSLKASFDYIEEPNNYNLPPFFINKAIPTSNSTSLAVVGSYKLNKNWQLIGTLSAKNLSNVGTNSVDNNREEIAIIGTSYSF